MLFKNTRDFFRLTTAEGRKRIYFKWIRTHFGVKYAGTVRLIKTGAQQAQYLLITGNSTPTP